MQPSALLPAAIRRNRCRPNIRQTRPSLLSRSITTKIPTVDADAHSATRASDSPHGSRRLRVHPCFLGRPDFLGRPEGRPLRPLIDNRRMQTATIRQITSLAATATLVVFIAPLHAQTRLTADDYS